jgi:hypothetical protein
LYQPPVYVQTKLAINTPGDEYEQESDAMADKVMRMPTIQNDGLFFQPKPSIIPVQRKCAVCEQEDSYEEEADRIANQAMATSDHSIVSGAPPHIQRFLGNQPTGATWDFSRIPLYPTSAPVQRLAGPIQRKLKVGAIDDPLEHEADRVAHQVMCMPASDAVTTFSRPQVSRKCDKCEDEKLQKKETGPQTAASEAPASVHETLGSPGQPLDQESRAFFEPRFGRDLSEIRVHADARAAESAHSVYARAYTVGNHLVFGRDQYAPHTADGRHLLAHELTHTLQQQAGAPTLRRDPPESPAPAPVRPDLETRLKVIEEAGPSIGARLNQIIRTGGPMLDAKKGAKVIGAAKIEIEGYQGPKEMRAINGADTDALGKGAAVYHATTPTNRTLTQTQGAPTAKGGRTASITGPRKESIYPHINDAEIKIFEDIISRLPPGAKGTIYFTTVRYHEVNGEPVIDSYPACSGCIRASFEAGGITGIDLVSHAPVHPVMANEDLGKSQTGPGAQDELEVRNPQRLKPGKVHLSKVDADMEQSTGEVVPGSNTDAALSRWAQRSAPKPPSSGLVIEIGTGIASLSLGWLAAHLKARVDQKTAQKQIDAVLNNAKKRIKENPDEALKKMMFAPEVTV